MSAGFFFFLCFVVVGLIIWGVKVRQDDEVAKINAMSPDDRLTYLFGPRNEHLVCPHCQTKGLVHAKSIVEAVTSTGTVGGILKTNTESTTMVASIQHHCAKCSTTWKV
ncbi:hypothetical protein [Hydrogenophaga defluvii]|uniref:Uncharacterized protein n=1 Tax=Hydrogenophaga defluvii TaxID=249410 RepID=A0ABW2SFM3_9BURK